MGINMRNLVTPNFDDINCFINIANSKRDTGIRECLLSLEASIEYYYTDYVTKGSTKRLHELTPQYDGDLNGEKIMEKNSLLHCYNRSTNNLSEMKVKIKELQDTSILDICQYCGINSPKTFDHYFPKQKFPEFCIFAKNLIPCCWECNKNKTEIWIEDGNRKILNLYYDTITDKRYLYADIQFRNNNPVAIYQLIQNGIDDNYFNLIKSHFEELDLLKRYSDRSSTEIGTIRDSIKNISNIIPDTDIKLILGAQADAERANKGQNYWKGALVDAISSSDEFFDWLLTN